MYTQKYYIRKNRVNVLRIYVDDVCLPANQEKFT